MREKSNGSIITREKLLVLGGSYQHRKIVKKARELGIETYVTDYLELEKSPAKKMADHPLMIDINDVDEIVRFCVEEKIDGVIGPYLDVTQIPYYKICEELGLPCFGDSRQHTVLTDKITFKRFCVEHGADVIPDYTMEQVLNDEVIYPLLIKPADSRGSRGQSICNDKEEVMKGVEFATRESKSGDVLIERYMGMQNDLQLVYLVIDGEPVLYKTEDRFLGPVEEGLDKLCMASIAPSRNEQAFRRYADQKTKKLIKALGLKNAPVFLQCFFDGERALYYDPGLRMPGDDYDDAQYELDGIDIPELLIKFALSGKMSLETREKIRNNKMHGYVAMVFPCLKEGTIKQIDGILELKQNSDIVSYSIAYKEGDRIQRERNVKQRFGEFVIKASDIEMIKNTIDWLFGILKVIDEKGDNMLIACFDPSALELHYMN